MYQPSRFPDEVYTFWSGMNPEYDSDFIRFTYSSLVQVRSVVDYNFLQHKWKEKKAYAVKGGYDPSQFVSKRLWATAEDGVQIPISIVHHKDIKLSGDNPCFLGGYGSYGSNTEPYFSSARLSLLKRGFVFAMAHIRGGAEMGRQWYESGKFLHKKNTFSDFIACAEKLISDQYTSSNHLVINGGSAGGLLMGAVVNSRPDLFKAVVTEVPFVDVINTMLDESIPLTITEYDEWGNPNEQKYFDYMLSYSPYDNIKAQSYPHLLITAGLNDPRVQYWEPAKYCAKLRYLRTDEQVLIMNTNMGAGHGGNSGRYGWIKDLAKKYAFIFSVLEINEKD